MKEESCYSSSLQASCLWNLLGYPFLLHDKSPLSVLILHYQQMCYYLNQCSNALLQQSNLASRSSLSCSSWEVHVIFGLLLFSRPCSDASPFSQYPPQVFTIQVVHQVFLNLGSNTIWSINGRLMVCPSNKHEF